jgi:hypothetical protein
VAEDALNEAWPSPCMLIAFKAGSSLL